MKLIVQIAHSTIKEKLYDAGDEIFTTPTSGSSNKKNVGGDLIIKYNKHDGTTFHCSAKCRVETD